MEVEDPSAFRVSRKDYVLARERLIKHQGAHHSQRQQDEKTIKDYRLQTDQDSRIEDISVIGNSGKQYKKDARHEQKCHPAVVLKEGRDSFWTPRRGDTYSLSYF